MNLEPKARTANLVFIDVPVPIRTPRLVLRPPHPSDGPAIAEAVAESYDDLHPWFHAGMGPRQVETDPQWQENVACRFLAQFTARERLVFYAWTGETLCAFVELQPDWRTGRMKLSYWVRSSRTRMGFGTEAVGAITRYAFDALDARLVTVGHAAGNVASAGLISHLGFEPVARQPLGYEMPEGTLVDGFGYAMTDPSNLPDQPVTWEFRKDGSLRTIRKQYHRRAVGADFHVWDVHRLIRASRGLDVRKVPLDAIRERDENWWYGEPGAAPTPRSIADHVALVEKTDLAHPIILCADGRLMDGMHRVVKAEVEGHGQIRAVRFPVTPAPDYITVSLDELPYPDEKI